MAKRYVLKSKRRRVARRSKRRATGGKGGFRINRRIPMLAINASQTVVGSFSTTNATVCVLGTPVAALTGGTNYFDVPFALEFHLSDLDTYTDLTSIAEKYRIAGASVKFLSNPGSYFSGAPLPFIQMVSDFDDAVAPTISSLNQKMGLRTKTFNNIGMASVLLRPKPSMQVYGSVLTTGYAVPRSAPYLDCTTAVIPHYGLKGVFRNVYAPGTTAAVQNLVMDISLSVNLKDLQ